MKPYWQARVYRVVTDTIDNNRVSFGRALATFLASQVMRLDAKFGPSISRTESPVKLKRNRYKIAARVLESLGYSQHNIADTLWISQTAVARLLRR